MAQHEAALAKDLWLGGAQPSQADNEAFSACTEAPNAATHPNAFAWYCLCARFTAEVRKSWAAAGGAAKGGKQDAKKAAPKKEEKPKDDDDFDPFADEEEDEEAEKAKMERMKEIAKTAKNYGKAKPVAKSIIVWEVKPWGEETDLDEMAKLILSIEQDGLQWKTEYKKEPIAYGVYKLIIGATVEDEKVSTDDIAEKIEAFEDHVQSVDVQSFNKL